MKHLFTLLSVFSLAFLLLFNSTVTYAATFRTGDSVDIQENEKNLKDLYLFGNSVNADAPVENDITAAGKTVTLNGNTTGGIITAGSDILIRSHVGTTIRAAGGNIVISGPVNNDVLIAAGTAKITNSASISGDLLFAGGQLEIDAPIKGNIYLMGGDVTINNTVGGNITGDVSTLTIGKAARINGDITYRADEKATVQNGAMIKGKQHFQQTEAPKQAPTGISAFLSSGSIYKLTVDIIISLLLLILFPIFIKDILENIVNSPGKSTLSGFLFMVLWPLLSLFLLLLLVMGVGSFLLYFLVLLFAMYIGKLFIGWWLLQWWLGKNKHEYILDWKAAVVGPIVIALLSYLPIIGWLALLIIYLMSVGGIVKYFLDFSKTQREAHVTQKA